MMDKILNASKQHAEQAQGDVAKTRYGLVDAYDPNTYSVKVKLQPDDTLTGWLPIKSVWVGNQWGMFCPPSIGDQVVVDFIEGDIDNGIVRLGSFNDQDRPLPCPTGEFWLIHKSGSVLKFLTNGDVQLNSAGDLTLNATGKINMTSGSDIVITSSTLKHNGKNIGSTHAHSGVQAGTGNTGQPV